MMKVEGPDGRVFEFPDGTSRDEMKRAMRRMYGQPKIERLRERVPEAIRAGPADAALQSMMFNLGDEAAGGVAAFQALFTDETVGDAYERGRDLARDRLDLYRMENPAASVAADVAGGAMVPASTLRRGAGIASNVARGAAAGAGYGAASGAGAARGGVDERMRGARTGAAVGGALGAAIPLGAAAGGALTRGVGDAVGGRLNPRGYAVEKVAERMSDSNMTPARAAGRIEAARRQTGQRLALGDVSGQPSRDLLRTASNIPGPARQRIQLKLGQRAAAQPGRVRRIIGNVFADPDGYGRTADDILALRTNSDTPVQLPEGQETTIGDLWQRAMSADVQMTPKLKELLKTPAGRRALSIAREMAENRRVPFDPDNPSMRDFQYIKRALDRVIQQDRVTISPFGAQKTDDVGSAIESVRRELLAELDVMNPAYKQARQASMTAFEKDEALEFGRKALQMTPEQVRRTMKGFTDGQREVAQVGFAEGLRRKIDTTGDFASNNDVVKRIFNTAEQRNIARAMFGDNTTDFATLQEAMRNEVRMRRTYEAVTGNSSTARQLADMQEAGGLREAAGAAMTAVTQGPVQAALQFVGSRIRMLGGFTPEVADQVQRILLQTDPAKVRALAQELAAIGERRASAQATRNAVVNALVRALGIQADEVVTMGDVGGA